MAAGGEYHWPLLFTGHQHATPSAGGALAGAVLDAVPTHRVGVVDDEPQLPTVGSLLQSGAEIAAHRKRPM